MTTAKLRIIPQDGKAPHIVDTSTGEVIFDGIPAVVFPRKAKISEAFLMAMQEGLRVIAKAGLTGREMQVFLLILSTMNFENWVDATQTLIASELGMAPRHVCTAFKTLVTKGMLVKGTTPGGVTGYRVSPFIAWRGSSQARSQHISKYWQNSNLPIALTKV